MSKRINITLPETTLALLNRFAPKGDRSRFISKAFCTMSGPALDGIFVKF